ncbi:ParM/StbA family protein [Ruminococcus sp. CLA-AA-H200]|uniref:ParM/StbA family protein n=1 Tax=Ruminococcus turbiniformis TaxID=2881258 RepID=A0ABS8G0W2_9FIRM|nr:ParM/StbA family protein [Ruminococcus turbiniformis]MCC2254579.1 ParM/StbA family protein [Ruminococcus turbiniformis]
MQTAKFRTRQEIRRAQNPKGNHYIIGLDAGYSSMKCCHESGYFCFPSYVRRLDQELMFPSGEDILYRDLKTGELYIMGYSAQNMAGSLETNDTDGELYSRKRYGNRNFQILCNAAIAMALEYKTDNREILIQTGLPSAYETADTPEIKKALSKPARFELRIGDGKWKEYGLEIKKDNIFVMAQPAGSLYSVLIQNDGKYTKDARSLLFSNVLVMDIGFGTFDFYGIKNRAIVCRDSIDEIGMKQVLSETSAQILKQTGEDIRLQALQKKLTAGTIICLNEDTMQEEEKPIAPFLEEANDKVFQTAINKAKSITSSFRDYQYLIVTGGTGAAWMEKIQKYLSGMKSLVILPGNLNNDKIPMIYSNVRGYYMYRYMVSK